MSKRKQGMYPCSIYMEHGNLTGWCVIMRGHNLTPEQIQKQLNKVQPGTQATAYEQFCFVYVPRIKWCENAGISPCDSEGDWHAHWTEVVDRGYPDTHFTVVQYEYVAAS